MAVEIRTEEEQLKKLKELKNTKTSHITDSQFVYRILIPAAILFLIGIAFPMITGIVISFRDSSTGNYFGTRFTRLNYYNLLRYAGIRRYQFWQYTYQTLFFAIVAVFLEFWLGLIFALLLNKKFRGRGLARATLLIPWALPTVASATIFRVEFFASLDNNGLFNNLIAMMGGNEVSFFGTTAETLFSLPLPFMGGEKLDITTTMFSSIFVDVWKTTPYFSLLILAALQVVPQDLQKAGSIAGASGWQKFWKITWPLIVPGIGTAIVFRMMDAIRVYDAIVVFNDESVFSMTYQAFSFWRSTNFGRASAVAVLEFIIIAVFAGIILTATSTDRTKPQGEQTQGIIKWIKQKFEKEENGDEETEDDSEETDIFRKGIKEERLAAEGKVESVSLVSEDREEPEIREISESYIKWIKIKRILKKISFTAAVILMCFWCAGPFIWILLRSFRDPYIYNAQEDFELFPKVFNFNSYKIIFQESVGEVAFERAMLNSFILSTATGLVVLLIGAFAAYALAKFRFKIKPIVTMIIFSMTSLPPLIIIIPYYVQIQAVSEIVPFLDLHDNLLGLVLPYAAFNLPLAVFVLKSFFEEIPDDLWKAAKVDGASRMQIFWRVLLPLTVPGLFTCFILVFIAAWNELLFAQIWLISGEKYTIPRAILGFLQSIDTLGTNWVPNLVIMAATSIATVPLVILVLIFQRQIISGITSGAVKG